MWKESYLIKDRPDSEIFLNFQWKENKLGQICQVI